ncbi:MAG: hypothetical protein ACI853_001899 [Paracoccaceae bacterium]|jgi:hypothetical protein
MQSLLVWRTWYQGHRSILSDVPLSDCPFQASCKIEKTSASVHGHNRAAGCLLDPPDVELTCEIPVKVALCTESLV